LFAFALLPDTVEVDVDEPLFVCVTVVELELLDVALPVVTDAVELPLFEPALVFDEVPPALPAVLSLVWSPYEPSTFPPLADASLVWSFPLNPLTPDRAEFPPLFETAIWLVPTHELWLMLESAFAEFDASAWYPFALALALLASADAVESPELFWLTLVFASFLLVELPVLTVALDVPSFEPVLSLLASPPRLPAVLSLV
jgi:hypothetical protein